MNPFKEYVRRRNGKVGQRFAGSIVEIKLQAVVYGGELMLCGWADTEKGKTVKFWLDEEAERHPFAGFDKRTAGGLGTMFMGAFAILDCDQKDIDPEARKIVENGGRRLSSQIHLMITSAQFAKFMTERSRRTATLHQKQLTWSSIHNGEMMTKAYVKAFLGIESLADLDRDKGKAEMFHKVFRQPFARWSGRDPR